MRRRRRGGASAAVVVLSILEAMGAGIARESSTVPRWRHAPGEEEEEEVPVMGEEEELELEKSLVAGRCWRLPSHETAVVTDMVCRLRSVELAHRFSTAPLAAHRFRASVRSRWQGVSVGGLCAGDGGEMPPRRARKFATAAACLAAAQRGGAALLDAEDLVERSVWLRVCACLPMLGPRCASGLHATELARPQL